MNIDTIKNGYVIDHITAGNAIKIYRLLDLENIGCQVALITNAKSKKTGTKDLLKNRRTNRYQFRQNCFYRS